MEVSASPMRPMPYCPLLAYLKVPQALQFHLIRTHHLDLFESTAFTWFLRIQGKISYVYHIL